MAQARRFDAQTKIEPFPENIEGASVVLSAWNRSLGWRPQMVRIFLASAVLVSALGLAQAAVPQSQSINTPPPSALKQSYVVFFEAGKSSLTPEARVILQSAAHQAYAMPKAKVRVSLPTGANGTAALFRDRARAVKAELVRDGIQPRSIGNADRPGDAAHSSTDPAFRKWLDRSATVEILPLADSDGQVG
jgi:hypothetical protein